MTLPEINTPSFQADLHANYEKLRKRSPVHVHDFGGSPRVSLLRYDDASAALRDPRFGVLRIPQTILANARASGHTDLVNLARVMSSLMLLKDDDDHARLRRLVVRAFTPRMVERSTEHIRALVRELLDSVGGASRIDVIEQIAVPLPVVVIAEILGVPTRHRVDLKQWSADFAPLLDRTLNTEGLLPAARACTGFAKLFGVLFEARRRKPRDDLISALVADEGDGALSEDELLATCLLLLVAGHETTTHLIGNGLLALLEHPEQLSWLRLHPESMAPAVEELARFEGPLMRILRHTREDLEVRGVEIPAGTVVDVVLAAANRDPERFERPHQLDLVRPDNRHLAFGLGTHFCLGAALARLETRIVLEELPIRFPALKHTGEPLRWRRGSVFRALESLPVSL